jgi:hypothetical protein
MRRRPLLALAVVLPLGACAGLTGSDPELYQSLSDTDVKLASRTLQTGARRHHPALVQWRDWAQRVDHADPDLHQRRWLLLPGLSRGTGGRDPQRPLRSGRQPRRQGALDVAVSGTAGESQIWRQRCARDRPRPSAAPVGLARTI